MPEAWARMLGWGTGRESEPALVSGRQLGPARRCGVPAGGSSARELAHARGGRVLGAFGSRHRLTLDAQTLRANIPDLSERDVFICGPERFTTMVAGAARRAGVARARLHVEGFGA